MSNHFPQGLFSQHIKLNYQAAPYKILIHAKQLQTPIEVETKQRKIFHTTFTAQNVI